MPTVDTKSISGKFWKIERPKGEGGLYFPVEIELKNGNIVSIRRGNGDMWDIVESKISERMHAQTDHD